jgi:hypothetical protein
MRARVAAAAIVAAPLLVGAQQQQASPRGSWPCGGRLDPSYFQIAEASGGHLLLLAPEEIADSATLLTAYGQHPQTILRLAGSVPRGLQEFQAPIDPSVESVLFSISVQCLDAAEILGPGGVPVGGDGVTDLFNFRAQRMVIVKRPQPGLWTVRVQGSGVSAVVVQAKSAIGIAQIERVDSTLRIRMSGPAANLRASILTGTFQKLADLPLSMSDTAGVYVSRLSPGTQPFRVLIAGTGPDGVPFQRMYAPLLAPHGG